MAEELGELVAATPPASGAQILVSIRGHLFEVAEAEVDADGDLILTVDHRVVPTVIVTAEETP